MTLIESGLTNLPTYNFDYYKEHDKEIENIQFRFLLGDTNEKRTFHLVEWKSIKDPYDKGGLGIRSILVQLNITRKVNLKIYGGNSLWWRVITTEFGIDKLGWDPRNSRSSYGVGSWKKIDMRKKSSKNLWHGRLVRVRR